MARKRSNAADADGGDKRENVKRRAFDPARMAVKKAGTGASAGSGGGAHLFAGAGGSSEKSGTNEGQGVEGGAGGGASAGGPISVSQLAAIINRALGEGVPTGLRVVGEVSQFRVRTHWYFDVKDEEALVSCVMFASSARKAGFEPRIGQKVLLTGRVDYYAKQGKVSFMVDRIEPIGEGALEAAYRKLCEEIRGLGWMNEERKRPLPMFPRRVAVVTSRTGAALQDVLDTLKRRCPAVEVVLVDVRVQGEGAAGDVAKAVEAISKEHEKLGIDVVLVTRGGGSREDLWAFNDREIARAIVGCRVPVVAAIGHETDVTIAELVADLRCATPTQAAMRIAPDAGALARQLETMRGRMAGSLSRQIQLERSRLGEADVGLRSAMRAMIGELRHQVGELEVRLEKYRPVAVYAQRAAKIETARLRLESAMRRMLERVDLGQSAIRLESAMQTMIDKTQSRLSQAARGLELVGPMRVLERGYSVTMKADGSLLKSVKEVRAGDRLVTRVADGSVESVVEREGVDAVQRPKTGGGGMGGTEEMRGGGGERGRGGRGRRSGGAEGGQGLFDS